VRGAGEGRSRSGSGAVSGGYRKRRAQCAEISTAPAPLTCSVTTLLTKRDLTTLRLANGMSNPSVCLSSVTYVHPTQYSGAAV